MADGDEIMIGMHPIKQILIDMVCATIGHKERRAFLETLGGHLFEGVMCNRCRRVLEEDK